MGIFGKLFKGPEIDQAKSADSKQKMRRLFDSVVPDGGQYQLVAAYTEDAKRFNLKATFSPFKSCAETSLAIFILSISRLFSLA